MLHLPPPPPKVARAGKAFLQRGTEASSHWLLVPPAYQPGPFWIPGLGLGCHLLTPPLSSLVTFQSVKTYFSYFCSLTMPWVQKTVFRRT